MIFYNTVNIRDISDVRFCIKYSLQPLPLSFLIVYFNNEYDCSTWNKQCKIYCFKNYYNQSTNLTDECTKS